MEIRENVIVPLGYGKFVRADKIIALEPIEDNRGPGRRTIVFVDQIPNPIIASRTEQAIFENIVQTPKEVLGATAALELLRDLLDDISQVGPMLRKSIKKEAALDLDQFERKIKEIIGVFAVISGMPLLNEVMSIKEIIGCVLMFIAVIITQLPKKDSAI